MKINLKAELCSFFIGAKMNLLSHSDGALFKAFFEELKDALSRPTAP